MKEDVQKVLNRFESYTRILARDDRREATGYEWGGTLYVGPKYLNANRSLSDERRAALIGYMAKAGISFENALVFERADAERRMIQEGLLVGVEPKERPDLMRDQAPIIDIREKEKAEQAARAAAKATEMSQVTESLPMAKAKVYPFPRKGKQIDLEAQRFYDSLNPEQKLKLQTLKLFQIGERDIMNIGITVDEAFRITADEFCK
ncbi:MAG: hypothetical protein K0Q73_7827 [Paenibacillus sp.]|jgi:hypothetical protein|uniref:hypothetical protein n=1 Tax=Paenibacillus sp. GCM10012303 TaxID=3317340 RepID=UPI0029DF95DB|nr:hypothetical protein [Paenibacillus sp.]